jgi:hypothetical protein
MTLLDLYDKIKNPLDNPKTIDDLLLAYNSVEYPADYYDKSLSLNNKLGGDKTSKEDKNEFYALLFNLWKKNIVSMSKEKLDSYRAAGANGIIYLHEYLKDIGDVRSKTEIDYINYDVSTKYSEANHYIKSIFSDNEYFEVVNSDVITKFYQGHTNIKHRLYINAESPEIYRLGIEFTTKCAEYNLPYLFKFERSASRSDAFVIYSDNDNLLNYLDVLKEIKAEKPYLIANFGQPPLFSGVIDGYIGYGSEPDKDMYGNQTSFNMKRAHFIYDIIDLNMNNWLRNNNYMMKECNCLGTNLIDYVIRQSVKNLNQSLIKQKAISINQADINKLISEMPKQQVQLFIENYATHRDNSNLEILKEKIVTSDLSVKMDEKYFVDAIKSVKRIASLKDPELKKKIRKDIDKNAPNLGIDALKFCFDESVVKNFNKINQNQKIEDINKETEIKNKQEIAVAKSDVKVDENKAYENNKPILVEYLHYKKITPNQKIDMVSVQLLHLLSEANQNWIKDNPNEQFEINDAMYDYNQALLLKKIEISSFEKTKINAFETNEYAVDEMTKIIAKRDPNYQEKLDNVAAKYGLNVEEIFAANNFSLSESKNIEII